MRQGLATLARDVWQWWRPKIGPREYAVLVWQAVLRHKVAWIVFLLVLGAIFVFSHFYSLHFTVSESMPYKLVLVDRDPPAPGALKRGDMVAWEWPGGLIYGKGARFLKFVEGLPGDSVMVEGRCFSIHKKNLGCAKTHSRQGLPLEAAQGGVVPPGRYYLYAPHKDSLDSRYAAVGFVPHELIIGRAYPIW